MSLTFQLLIFLSVDATKTPFHMLLIAMEHLKLLVQAFQPLELALLMTLTEITLKDLPMPTVSLELLQPLLYSDLDNLLLFFNKL